MGLYAIKPRFRHVLKGMAERLALRGVHPDALTWGAVVCSALGAAAILLAPQAPALWLAVPLASGVRIVLNALDGMVAELSGLARPWGEVLNELCDRISDVFLLGVVAVVSGQPVLGGGAVVAALLSSHLGVLSRAAGASRQYGGIMAKADRMLYLSVASVLALLLGPWVMTYLLAIVLLGALATIYHRWRQTYNELKVAGT